jgi:hypothetical protein
MSDETTRRLAWRGVRSPCPKCTGAGRRGYPGGQTWRGGMGTTLVTWDVCDGCWGSGDVDAPGVDLRAMEAQRRALAVYEDALAAYDAAKARGAAAMAAPGEPGWTPIDSEVRRTLDERLIARVQLDVALRAARKGGDDGPR